MKWLSITLLACISLFARGQTTQPVTLPTVLVLKFEQVDQAAGFAWLSRSIQQSLVTDINRSRFARATVLPEARSAPTTDTSVALGLAREQRADFVVVGGYQAWDDALRITAQVIDVKSGEGVGSLKSTGDQRSLFLMQDGLVMQLRGLLAPRGIVRDPVPAGMLEIPTQPALAVASAMNRYEIVRPQPWRVNAQNRHLFLNRDRAGYWFGGCGWWGWGPWRFSCWW